MLDFLGMLNNYEDRKVDKYKEGDIFISTVKVSDSSSPYETAIGHPLYNNSDLIVVEEYDSIESAKNGHKKWVKTMTEGTLPEVLEDVSSSTIGKFDRSLGSENKFECKDL